MIFWENIIIVNIHMSENDLQKLMIISRRRKKTSGLSKNRSSHFPRTQVIECWLPIIQYFITVFHSKDPQWLTHLAKPPPTQPRTCICGNDDVIRWSNNDEDPILRIRHRMIYAQEIRGFGKGEVTGDTTWRIWRWTDNPEDKTLIASH